MVQRGLATSTLETGGSASGNWTVPGGFFTPWSGTPTVFLSTTGVGWVAQPWTSFRIFKDGNTTTPLLRPHINATTFQIIVYAKIVGGGTFSTLPRVELYDDAFTGKNWVPDTVSGVIERFDRAVYTSTTVALTSSLVATTFNLPAEMLRGYEASTALGWSGYSTLPLGGVRNFGDLGLRVYAPGGPSSPGTTTCELSFEIKVQDTEPFADRSADWGVRPPNLTATGGWASVHYGGVQNNAPLPGREYYVREVDGTTLNSTSVLPDAITRAGNASAAYGVPVGQPVVIELESFGSGPSAFTLQPFRIGDNSATPQAVALWKNASGNYRRVEDLIVRSVDRGLNSRAQVISQPTVSGETPDGWKDLGHVSFAGIRFFSNGSTYCFQTSFDMWSDTFILGCYDCHLTGLRKPNQSQPIGYEYRMGMRLGYHGVDLLDCKSGTAEEHTLVYKGSSPHAPSQILRCENTFSGNFYPLHPDPDTTFANGRFVNTFHQFVARTNPCGGAGEGPAAYGVTLVEDCTSRNSQGATHFTITGHLGPYISRRCAPRNIDTSGGGGIQFWGDTLTGNQDNQPKGHHTSIGQHDGPDIAIACNALPVKPEEYPHTGTAVNHGPVVIEDFGGQGITSSSPIRTAGCKSVVIRRGNFTAHPKLPTIHDLQMNGGSGSWGNSAPYQSLAFTLEGMGATPQTYKGWRASSSQIAFGDPNNPMGPQGGSGSSNHILQTAHVNALKAPSTAWPPWRQGIASITQTTVGGQTTYKVGYVFPGMSPPTTYGTKHTGGTGLSGSSIIFPGRNTFSGAVMKMTLSPLTVGGGGGGGGPARISGQSDMAFTATGQISANVVTEISGSCAVVIDASATLGANLQANISGTCAVVFGGSGLLGTVLNSQVNTNPMKVLLIDIDDLGSSFFEAAATDGVTPNLTRLRAQGMEFTNFWAAPLCSLARARALTGLDAYRSGNLVGSNLNPSSVFGGPSGMWITKSMPGRRTKRGKWHMSRLGAANPADEFAVIVDATKDGYDSFSGSLANLSYGPGDGYTTWELGAVERGFPATASMSREFATNYVYKAAEADLKAGAEFVSVSFNAIHEPLDPPPNNQPFGYYYPSGTGSTVDKKRDLLRHLDSKLGCLCDRAIENGYIVIVWFDNGTADEGKGTVFEAGIRTKLFVFGGKAGTANAVTTGVSTRLVQATDIWGTVRWLRGCADYLSAVDSKVFVDAFLPNQAVIQSARQFLTCDDGPFLGVAPDPATWRRGIRDARWKLIDAPDETPVRHFYDLQSDPTEQNNLYGTSLNAEQTTAYNLLVANLQQL